MGFLPRRLSMTPDAPATPRSFSALAPRGGVLTDATTGQVYTPPAGDGGVQTPAGIQTLGGNPVQAGGGGINEMGPQATAPTTPSAPNPSAPGIGGTDPNQIAAYQQALHDNPQYQMAWQKMQTALQHLPELVASEGIGQGPATQGPSGGEGQGDATGPGNDPIEMARQVVFQQFGAETKGLITLPKDYMINPMDGSLTYVPPDHAGRNQLIALAGFIGGGALAGYLGALGAAAPSASAGIGGGAAATGGTLGATATTGAIGALAQGLASGTSAAGLGLAGSLGGAAAAGGVGATGAAGTLAATQTAPTVGGLAAAPLASTATTPAVGGLAAGGAGSTLSGTGAAAATSALGGSSAIPWWARLAGTAGSLIAGKLAGDSASKLSPLEQTAVTGATGAADTLSAQGKSLSAGGLSTIAQGLPQLQKAGDYYGILLGGNRSAMSLATAGPRASITDTYRGAERGIERSGAQGGVRDLAKAELSRSRASDLSALTTGVQPAAAAGVTDIGARTTAAGLGLTQQGTQALSGVGNIYDSLLGAGYKNRVYGNQQGQQAGSAVGSMIFDLLSGIYGKK